MPTTRRPSQTDISTVPRRIHARQTQLAAVIQSGHTPTPPQPEPAPEAVIAPSRSKEGVWSSLQASTRAVLVVVVLGLAAFGLYNLLPILAHLLTVGR